MTWLGARMRRCHDCQVRFFSLGASAILWEDLGRINKKLAGALLGLGGLAASLWSVWWIISRMADFPR